MEKKIALLLVLVLLLAGCGVQSEPTDGTTMGTVPDLFTQPTTVPQATTKPADTTPTVPDRDRPVRLGLGFEQQEMTYTGGEMQAKVMVYGEGYSNIGVGLRLFVDGQPQPYYTAEDATVKYMHTFYPPEGMHQYYEVIFTPVAGQAGQTVELYVASVTDPTYFLGDGDFAFRHTAASIKGFAQLTYEATPSQQTLPEVADVLTNWSCNYVDATDEELGQMNAAQIAQEVKYQFFINDYEQCNNFYGVTAEDTVKIRFEAWGTTYVNFGLVIYLDNEPVSVNAEDLMLFEIKNGQKTVIEAEISMVQFDGKSVVNAVLVPRNRKLCGVENRADLDVMKTSYFAAVEEYWDLLK